jgi:hypothetical protein
MRMIYAYVTFTLLAQSLAAAPTEPFSFAGLTLKTTMADLQTRYPRSTALDTVVYVSTEETHDHISTIGLSSNGAARTLSIAFEREQRGGRAMYPSCEKLLGVLTDRYGTPANVVDAQEEKAHNRRFHWKRSAERLTLSCFRMPRQPLYAERLTIASDE